VSLEPSVIDALPSVERSSTIWFRPPRSQFRYPYNPPPAVPTTPPDAPPRESIELRTFVFYPD